MSEKTKILLLGDHPMAPSGVGTQLKYICETLLKTGRYQFICLGGAMKHDNYDPQNITGDEWDDGDFRVFPVDGYGSPEMIRSILWTERPDVLLLVYYHVWDNYPFPQYNKKWYDSTDVIASISKVTHDIVNNVSPDTENHYVPHAVQADVFKKFPKDEVAKFRLDNMGEEGKDKMIFFWNNRNARRKQSGTLALWFGEFAEEVGPENVCLIMHTDPKDLHGQDLEAILNDHNYDDGRILISRNKVPPTHLLMMYNMADCTVNISDAEGFGLATLESLSCGTPIIVTMTGGLQEQVTDGEEWFGIGIEPASKATIGSQEVPYIHEDRISREDFKSALRKMYNMTVEEREELGAKGAAHVDKNYNFDDFKNKWIELMDKVVKERGSWETRKNYSPWEIKEIA